MPAVSDKYMISVLRPFVAATGPVLSGLRDADPFRLGRLAQRRAAELESAPSDAAPEPVPTSRLGKVRRTAGNARHRALDRLATSRLPGTPRWEVMTPEERDHWWVARLGRFTSAVASIPGIGGALARRLPVSDILGLAAQGLVVCAIAGEHGVTGRDEQVRLLGTVLFERDLRPGDYGDPHGRRARRPRPHRRALERARAPQRRPAARARPGRVADGTVVVRAARGARPAPARPLVVAHAGERARRRGLRGLQERALGTEAGGAAGGHTARTRRGRGVLVATVIAMWRHPRLRGRPARARRAAGRNTA
jgi:hypothetical protein